MNNKEDTEKTVDGLKREVEEWKSLALSYQAVYNEVAWLIVSGYDGPFMGTAVQNLFEAYAASNRRK